MTDLKTGKTYRVHHSRKGDFTLKVDADHGDFVSGWVLEGIAVHLVNPDALPGDPITIRKSLATFTEA